MKDSDSVPFRVTPVVFQVLFSLSQGTSHAYQIMKDVAAQTEGRMEVGPGSLHFTLSKLLDAELVAEASTRPAPDSDDPRRRYFELTAAGRRLLRDEAAQLAQIVSLARSRGVIPDTP